MARPEDFAMTLWDYRDELQWVRLLGWTEDELRSVPVHENATGGQEFLNLANFGGTSLEVLDEYGSPTSAQATSIRNM